MGDQAADLDNGGVMEFTVHGGTIGRAVDNNWSLPDPERHISGRHAAVQFQNGHYFIVDTSTNGVFLNDSKTRIGRGNFARLKSGDRFRIANYLIGVEIESESQRAKKPKAPEEMSVQEKDKMVNFAALLEDDLVAGTDTMTNLEDDVTELRDTPGGMVSPEDTGQHPVGWDMIDVPQASEKQRVRADPDPSMELLPAEDILRPELTKLELEMEPEPRPRPPLKPKAAARTASAAAKSTPKPPQRQAKPTPEPALAPAPAAAAARPAPRKSADGKENGKYSARQQMDPTSAFLEAAGLDPARVDVVRATQIMRNAGQVLREFVVGAMDSLVTRSELKNQFRVSQTSIQPGEFNPLKFSAGVDEALRGLLLERGSKYLAPVDAVRQSFNDLRTHQFAMLSAMRAAVDHMMDQFDPDELQERFDRGLKRGPLMGATNKLKYWDLYGDVFTLLSEGRDKGLPLVFSEAFAKTYEEVVQKQSKQRPKRSA